MLSMVNAGYKRIQVVCEDSDVFLLLLYHYQESELRKKDIDIIMQNPATSAKAISIRNTIESLSPTMVSSLLSAHALTGCDTVPQMYGIGKEAAIKLLNAQDLDGMGLLGNTDPNILWETIERGCIEFIRKLYGEKGGKNLLICVMQSGSRSVKPKKLLFLNSKGFPQR